MIQNATIEAVIFDLGNVLIDFDHRQAARKIANLSDKREDEIFQLFFDSELTEQFEEGKITPVEFFEAIKKTLNLKINYEKFEPIWNDIFFLSQKNNEVYNLALCLRQNYKIALVSNINVLHFEYIKSNFPILGAFSQIVTSYEVGVRKPHPLIYYEALELLDSPPERVFYTDDRPELIAGACSLGINGFIFQGADQLKKDFLSAGLKFS